MVCFLCKRYERKKRIIDSVSNRHPVPVLMELLNDVFKTSADGAVLPTGAWLCYPCFCSIEKAKILNDDHRQHIERLHPYLKQTGEACSLHSFKLSSHSLQTDLSRTPTTPRLGKRRARDSDDHPSPLVKRQVVRLESSTPVSSGKY